jgi:preprotein translocase subunit SecB
MKKNEHQGIAFQRLILEKVNFEVNPDFSFGGEPLAVAMDVNADAFFSEDKKNLRSVLTTNIALSGAEPSPMKILVAVAGYFSLEDGQSTCVLEEFAEIQAPAMLFPFMREVVANLTMRTDFPPLLLPPANIWALLGKKNTEKSKRGKKE